MKLSVIVPSLDGRVPASLLAQVAAACDGAPALPVEVVSVVGVRPVGKARNEGLRRAKGEYIAWVDADDEVAEDWLSEILSAISAGKSTRSQDAVFFDVKKTGGWAIENDMVWGGEGGLIDPKAVAREMYRDNWRMNSHLWRWVIARRHFEGVKFDETVKIWEDYLVLADIVRKCENIVYVPKKLYNYRNNLQSVIHEVDVDNELNIIKLTMARYASAPEEYKRDAFFAVMRHRYDQLERFALLKMFRECADERMQACLKESRQFMRRHFAETKTAIGWKVKFFLAGINCWWIQRLLHRAVFEAQNNVR